MKIRVAVVEDSRTTRKHLVRLFEQAGDFEVVGEAATRREIEAGLPGWRPDVVSLDVFLPDGTAPEVVRALMAIRPTPIVLVSDAPRSAAEVFEALAAGALNLLHKPRTNLESSGGAFLQLMRTLSKVRVRRRVTPPALHTARELQLVAIASSTGGPGALRELLGELPAGLQVPVVVAQHLSPGFEPAFARWLQGSTPLPVRLLSRAGPLIKGEVVLGLPGSDVRVHGGGRVTLERRGPGGYHPSGDVLFSSAAKAYPAGVLAVVLSGIGSDGAAGAREVAAHGGVVFAQDEASSVVRGMPAAAARAGVVSLMAAPRELGRAAARLLERR